MEVLTILQNVIAFTPEDITVLVSAFESALNQIGLVNREDPLTLMIAKQILAAAKEGERDPQTLAVTALTAFGLRAKGKAPGGKLLQADHSHSLKEI